MKDIPITIKEMGEDDSRKSRGQISLATSENGKKIQSESIRCLVKSQLKKDECTNITAQNLCAEKKQSLGDSLDSLVPRLPAKFTFNIFFMVLSVLLSSGMLVFCYCFYTSAFYTAFISDIVTLQQFEQSSIGTVFAIFNKTAFSSFNLHLLAGSVFLGFAFLVEFFLAQKRMKPLLVISAVLFIADLLLIIQVERKTRLMAELIGITRTTDMYFYLSLIIFGFVSTLVLGYLLNNVSNSFLGYRIELLTKMFNKITSEYTARAGEISGIQCGLEIVDSLEPSLILQWYSEGINQHRGQRGLDPLKYEDFQTKKPSQADREKLGNNSQNLEVA